MKGSGKREKSQGAGVVGWAWGSVGASMWPDTSGTGTPRRPPSRFPLPLTPFPAQVRNADLSALRMIASDPSPSARTFSAMRLASAGL